MIRKAERAVGIEECPVDPNADVGDLAGQVQVMESDQLLHQYRHWRWRSFRLEHARDAFVGQVEHLVHGVLNVEEGYLAIIYDGQFAAVCQLVTESSYDRVVMWFAVFAEQVRQTDISYRRSSLATPGGQMVSGCLFSFAKRRGISRLEHRRPQ